ncbi:MAG: DUF3857 domain-containing protein [Prevotella sp.]|nr:DUF3857 domain-containing protein [Prevotella sp.]
MYLLRLFSAVVMLCSAVVSAAQTKEPNLKWGKPTDSEMTMTTYAPDPEAEAVVLCSQTELSYDFSGDSFRQMRHTRKRIKILKEQGKDLANGAVSYMYNERRMGHCEELTKLKAVAYNLVDGKVVKTKMESSMISHEDVDEQLRLTKFTVPQVTVGTVIEVDYQIDSDFYNIIDDWEAQCEVPVAYTSFDVTVPEYFIFSINERGSYPSENTKEDVSMSMVVGGALGILKCIGQHRKFVCRDLPVLRSQKLLFAPMAYGQRVSMELRAIQIPGVMSKMFTSDWTDVDRLLLSNDRFGRRIGRNPLKAEMAEAGIDKIAANGSRILAIYSLLKSKVAWNGDYALFAESASKVLKEGSGSNASINFILINMLNDAGFEAYPALMRSRDRGILSPFRVTIKEFNTFVVAVKVGEKLCFLDASVEDGGINVLPDVLLADRVRIVGDGRPYEWCNLSKLPGANTRTIVNAQLMADGTLQADVHSKLSGADAASLRRSFRESVDSTAFVATVAQQMGCDIEALSLVNHRGLGPEVERTLNVKKRSNAAGDMIYLNPWVINVMEENPLTEEQRTLPVEFPHKSIEAINSIVTLPEGYVVEELPQRLIMKSEDGALRCLISSEVKGRDLVSQCQIHIDKTLFTPSEYPVVKSFLDAVYKRLQDLIVIKKA